MSGPCTLGTYQYEPHGLGLGGPTRCTCTNCTEREAKVMAEANERRKALLALDQAMTDLAVPCDAEEGLWEYRSAVEGKLAAANEAWQAARRFIL